MDRNLLRAFGFTRVPLKLFILQQNFTNTLGELGIRLNISLYTRTEYIDHFIPTKVSSTKYLILFCPRVCLLVKILLFVLYRIEKLPSPWYSFCTRGDCHCNYTTKNTGGTKCEKYYNGKGFHAFCSKAEVSADLRVLIVSARHALCLISGLLSDI